MSPVTERNFVETLRELRQGAIVADLTGNMRELVAAVRATQGKGTLTLTITVKPAAKGDVTTLMISDAIKLSLPKGETGSTILYATEDNALQRRDPRQPELTGLAEVRTFQPPTARTEQAHNQ